MDKYDLVGVDGNAFSVMAYVRKAMQTEKLSQAEIDDYLAKAKSGDYNNLLCVSMEQLELCNACAIENDSNMYILENDNDEELEES